MNGISYRLSDGREGEITDPVALRRFYDLVAQRECCGNYPWCSHLHKAVKEHSGEVGKPTKHTGGGYLLSSAGMPSKRRDRLSTGNVDLADSHIKHAGR